MYGKTNFISAALISSNSQQNQTTEGHADIYLLCGLYCIIISFTLQRLADRGLTVPIGLLLNLLLPATWTHSIGQIFTSFGVSENDRLFKNYRFFLWSNSVTVNVV